LSRGFEDRNPIHSFKLFFKVINERITTNHFKKNITTKSEFFTNIFDKNRTQLLKPQFYFGCGFSPAIDAEQAKTEKEKLSCQRIIKDEIRLFVETLPNIPIQFLQICII